MFNNKIVKMKKELFIEAESIAYLIKDVLKRKLAFANTCTLFAFRNYIEKNNFAQVPVTNLNLFRVPAVAEKYGISDIYLDDIRIDVRASLDGKVFPIPKVHVKNSIMADFYVVFKGTKNPLKCEALGYIPRQDIIFDSQDDEYYYISVAILNPIDELKQKLNDFQPEDKTFFDTEHKVAVENFGAFLDGDLDEVKSDDLIKHLLNCPDCRASFVEYSFLEDLLPSVKHYPELEELVQPEVKEVETEEPVQPEIQENEEQFAPQEEASIDLDVPVVPVVAEAPDILSGGLEDDFIDLSEVNLDEDGFTDFSDMSQQDITGETDVVSDDIAVEEVQPQETDDVVDFSMETLPETETQEQEDFTDLSMETMPEIETQEQEDFTDLSMETLPETETQEQEDFADLSMETMPEEIQPEQENGLIDFSAESNLEETTDDSLTEIDIIETGEDQISEDGEIVMSEPLVPENNGIDIMDLQAENIQESDEEGISDIPVESSIFDSDESIKSEESSVNFNENSDDLDISMEINNDSLGDDFEINYTKNESDINLQFETNEEDFQPGLQLIGEEENPVEVVENDTSYTVEEVNTENENSDFASDINWNDDSDEESDDVTVKDIDTVYSEEENEIPDMESIKEKIVTKEPSKKNIVLITAISVIATGLLVGGFFVVNNMNGGSGSSGDIVQDSIMNGNQGAEKPEDINQAMANAFSNAQTDLKVSKISWQVEQSLSQNPAATEYLTTLGQSVGDNLDVAVPYIIVSETPKQARVLIKVNKNGEVEKIFVAESSGVEDLDKAIEQSVQKAIDSLPLSSYMTVEKNVNLILVVNF